MTGDTEVQTSATGRLNQAIANAVVRRHRRFVGRGPTRARAFYSRDVLVVVTQNRLTQGERSLVADGRREAVRRLRQELQRAMRAELVEAVESLTGRKVLAALSTNEVDPDVAADVFVLDSCIDAGAGDVRVNELQ